jgi:hypothetical protein
VERPASGRIVQTPLIGASITGTAAGQHRPRPAR